MELVGNFFSKPLVFFFLFELAIWVLALNENDDPFVQVLYFCLRKKKRGLTYILTLCFFVRGLTGQQSIRCASRAASFIPPIRTGSSGPLNLPREVTVG